MFFISSVFPNDVYFEIFIEKKKEKKKTYQNFKTRVKREMEKKCQVKQN